jgi:Domain of unknown function (DUF4082)/Bacterial Ig-like domain
VPDPDAPFSPVLLLAGPVLRRVTATSVSVWVATSQSCQVRLDVYGSIATLNRASGAAQTGTVAATSVGAGSQSTVRAGGALHFAVVTAQIAGVPPDTICSYNVTLDVQADADADAVSPPGWSGQWDLGGLKLLDLGDPSADYQGGLGYAEGRLPSFASPPADVKDLRLFHGSCFKLQGEGPSIMPNIDDILSDALPADDTAQKQRPHMLLLTGDQIYADDLATALSPFLTSIGASLLATAAPETVPVPSVGDVPVTQAAFPAGRRQKLIMVTAGMSSDDAPNHLLGFGEWCALYLLNWNGRLDGSRFTDFTGLWPKDLALLPAEASKPGANPDTPVVLDPTAPAGPVESLLTPLFPPLDSTDPLAPAERKVLAELQQKVPTHRDRVKKSGDDGDKVRRALANIPVLTICDDHEVTDDWFITGAWRARVLGSTLGRAMIRNAMLAYVLFQAWGNTPDAFATPGTPEAQLLALVPSLFPRTGAAPDPGVAQQIDHLLGLDDPTGTGTAPRVAFNYHLDIAGARLVVLDTRTHREYGTPDGPPGLLTAAALDTQLPISLTDDVPLLIVVSPAPVLGPRLIEEIVAPLGTRVYDFMHSAIRDKAEQDQVLGISSLMPFGDLYLDVEQWSARPAAFERFLSRVTRCPQVVILAGDVHYAASFTMDYQRFSVPADEGGVPPADPLPKSMTSRVVHFTASAIRNAWDPKETTFIRSISVAEKLEQVGFEGIRLGWTRMTPPVLTGNDLASGEARPLRARLLREPVILPTAGWRSQHGIRPAEWAYQVAPVIDTRTDDQRFAALATAGFTQVLGPSVPDAPAPPLDGDEPTSWVGPNGPYEAATALHAANVEGGAVTRTLVFANNVGVVTFSQPDPAGPLSVQMAVYFIRAHPASDDEKPHPYVVHAADLTPVLLSTPDQLGPSSIWNNVSPSGATDAADTSAVNLGVQFQASGSGNITGVRFYKEPENTGTHVGSLWAADGTLLATGTFRDESASGWQQLDFSSPAPIMPGTTYVASYHTGTGHYALTSTGLSSAVTTGPLTALANGGVRADGSSNAFPSSPPDASNYWVDVVYSPYVGNVPPEVTTVVPVPGATGAPAPAALTAAFSQAVVPSTVSFTLADSRGNNVAGSVSSNSADTVGTFTPANPLAGSTTYTATVSGARNSSGTPMSSAYSWSFSTGAAAQGGG